MQYTQLGEMVTNYVTLCTDGYYLYVTWTFLKTTTCTTISTYLTTTAVVYGRKPVLNFFLSKPSKDFSLSYSKTSVHKFHEYISEYSNTGCRKAPRHFVSECSIASWHPATADIGWAKYAIHWDLLLDTTGADSVAYVAENGLYC